MSDAAREARAVLRAAATASLATILAGGNGRPYASLVIVAATPAGEPILLLSDLSEHAKNIAADSRVALMFDGTAGYDDPLAGPRLTVLGDARRTDQPADRRRFLARHPAAAEYAGFGDFAIYRIAVERAHFVAGFGRVRWIESADLLLEETICAALAEAEEGLVGSLNKERRADFDSYGRAVAGAADSPWTATGIDPDGVDLRAEGAVARLHFDAPATTPEVLLEAVEAAIGRAGEGVAAADD